MRDHFGIPGALWLFLPSFDCVPATLRFSVQVAASRVERGSSRVPVLCCLCPHIYAYSDAVLEVRCCHSLPEFSLS